MEILEQHALLVKLAQEIGAGVSCSGDISTEAAFQANCVWTDPAARVTWASFSAAYQVASTPRLPDLEPDQFWGAVRAFGYEEGIRAWVAGIEDPVARGFLSAKLDFAKHFERLHPFVEEARLALGLSDEELDSLWIFAAS